MAAEFVGFTNIRHVQQPEGSELCFPALMSAVSDSGVEEAHEKLKAAGISQEDGSTGILMGTVELDLDGAGVTIEPVELPEDAGAAIEEMENQFAAGRAMLLLYKKKPGPNSDPETNDYHWVIVAGFAQADEYKGPLHVTDPLREETALLSRQVVGEMIERSVDYGNGGQGVFAYSVSLDSGPSPESNGNLTVVPLYDREPEPRNDTYSATGQDKPVEHLTTS